MDDSPRCRGLRSCGFTLIEVAASVLIMAVLLGTVMTVYHRITETVIFHNARERATAVATRRMELLLSDRSEPNSAETQGSDPIETTFDWQLSLSRISIDNSPPLKDLSNTVIKAVITVEWDKGMVDAAESEKLEMVRYLSYLRPLPGHAVAVPMSSEESDPQWYIDLRERLGREPTAEETFKELVKIGDMPAELSEMLELTEDDKDDEPDQEEHPDANEPPDDFSLPQER